MVSGDKKGKISFRQEATHAKASPSAAYCRRLRLKAYIVLLFFWLLLTVSPAFTAPSLRLEISPRSGTLEDSFLFSVVVDGTTPKSEPLLRGGDDFKISYIGPRNEIKIINGDVQTRVSYNYRLTPKKEGLLKTPSAEVRVRGGELVAPGLSVKVGPSSAPPTGDPETVFVKQLIDKNSVFVGQQLVNTLELYASVNIIKPQVLDLSFDDFWSQELSPEEHSQKLINGTHYDITRLRYAIFPLKAGSLTLPARRIQGKIPMRRSRRSPFWGLSPFDDDFFGDFFATIEYQDKTFYSNPLSLEVKPLPDPPPNADDWRLNMPLVGTTALKVLLTPDPVKVGDSKTITLEITSLGNLNNLNNVPLDFGPAARVYAENPETKPIYDPVGLLTQKTFKLSVVPLEGRELKVPALRLLYFDPDEERYKVAKSRPQSFEVIGAPAAVGHSAKSLASSQAGEPERALTPTPSYPPYNAKTALERLSEQISLGLSLLMIAGAAIVAYVLYLVIHWQKARRPARELISAIDKASSIEDLQQTFEEYIQYRLKLPPETHGEPLKALIRSKVLNQDLRFALQALLDEFDELRYSGQANKAELSVLRRKVQEAIQGW